METAVERSEPEKEPEPTLKLNFTSHMLLNLAAISPNLFPPQKIVLLGGRKPDGTYSNRVFDYNRQTGVWTHRLNLPEWIAGAHQVTRGLDVYLIAWKRVFLWNGTSEEFSRLPLLGVNVGTIYTSAMFHLVL